MEDTLRKEYVLELIDHLELLFNKAETKGEQRLLYELMQHVRDSIYVKED